MKQLSMLFSAFIIGLLTEYLAKVEFSLFALSILLLMLIKIFIELYYQDHEN